MTPLLNNSMIEILDMVATERGRQQLLKSQGKFEYTCSDKEITHFECNAVLGEEAGEVAHEVNEGIGGRPIDKRKLLKELIEVAAVATAWAEKTLQEIEGPPDTDEILNNFVERDGRLNKERTEMYSRSRPDVVMSYCPATRSECDEPCVGSVCNKLERRNERRLPIVADEVAVGAVKVQIASPWRPNCHACKWSGMEPADMNLTCGHPDAGTFGLHIWSEPLPHCPNFSKFEQHPGRNPDGSIKMRKP